MSVIVWSGLTIGIYAVVNALYRRAPHWWLSPLFAAPVGIMAVLLAVGASYGDYRAGAGWLLWLLGPTMVAFAVPVFERRALLRRHWPALTAGMIAGSGAAVSLSWGMAELVGLAPEVQASIVPRSTSTPFAVAVSRNIGGVPELTAIFVVLTGVLGAALGQVLLHWLPVRSALARGALLGLGAHGAGVAKAHEYGDEEGSVAGLVMVLVGLLNVTGGALFAALPF